MKLLLDMHHSRLAAAQLRANGHDVAAASDDPALASLPDEELLRAATRDGRAVVTENTRDFDRIVRAWSVTGEDHAGVIFTSPRRYHRGANSYPANLTGALSALLENPPDAQRDLVYWLPRTALRSGSGEVTGCQVLCGRDVQLAERRRASV